MRRFALPILALIMFAAPARAQTPFDSLKALWTSQQYAQVIKPLVQLRTTAPIEQQLTIDYMIATSHCRLPDAAQRAKGRRAFDAMLLNHYRALSTAQQKQLREERDKCGASVPVNSTAPRYVVMASRKGPARATYNYAGGKQYYNVCAAPGGQRGIMTERTLEGTRSQPVWSRAQLDAARADVQALLRDTLRSQGNVRARDGIVVASIGSHNNAQLDTILDALIQYRDFYVREYGFPLPDTVLQVFLAPSGEDLVKVAKALHGLDLDPRLIGYSSLSDFTMIGIIPRTIYGTLMHELMHLLFRNNVPNAAPWLDEGLAALYEVSRTRGERVVGIPNWRGQILDRGSWRPLLAQLLGLDWTEFEGYGQAEGQARNHAFARYFVMYLQDKGKLPAVVRAVSTQPVLTYKASGDVVDVVTTSGKEMEELIARTLEMSVPQLNADFDAWLRTVRTVGWTPCN